MSSGEAWIDIFQWIAIMVFGWFAFDGWRRGNAIAHLIVLAQEELEEEESG